MRNELNWLQQRMKMKEVDLIGIPEKRNENVIEKVKEISRKSNSPALIENAVDNCYRVHFPSRNGNECFSAYKHKKELKAEEIGFPSDNRKGNILIRKDSDIKSKIIHVTSKDILAKLSVYTSFPV
ncbi:hypothetical protein HHI36_001824 [Cryptolaemus montrouzieri]|uniref:Uncharacterized protein n=1 Tax=Cryptolaemus montrouzieri TaxID=559131 RepID=A0ABD2P948_9CUCU